MGTVNKRMRQYTHEGAPAKIIDALSQLERSVMSCLLWEKEFYESGQTIADRIAQLVSILPAEQVANVAIQAKEDMRLRHVPLLLTRELCRTAEGRKMLKTLLPRVITRADDITEFLALYWMQKRTHRAPAKLPNQVKKHLGKLFAKFDEYQLAKYNGGSKSVTLRDAMKVCHPKAVNEEQSALWKRLVKGELATPDTWEVAISAAKPEEKKDAWTRLLTENKLGGLALLRNLRNMRQAGVSDEIISQRIGGMLAGRLLPINFISAARHNPQFEPVLETKFLECFAERPRLPGHTIIMVDVSGSMDEKLSGRGELNRIDVACSLAMIAREMCEFVRVFTFSYKLVEVPARRGFALRDAIVTSQPHGGTALGQAVSDVNTKFPEGRLIVISDEQSSDRVPERPGSYMINVASNKNGVGYGSWLHIDGWSDKVLDYISRLESNSRA